jgi:hypothetical protein
MFTFFDGRKGNYSFAYVDTLPSFLADKAILEEFFARYSNPPVDAYIATGDGKKVRQAIAFDIPGFGELYTSDLPKPLCDSRVRKIPGWVTPTNLFFPLGAEQSLGENNYWWEVSLPCEVSISGRSSYRQTHKYIQAVNAREACCIGEKMLPDNWDLDDSASAIKIQNPYDPDRLGRLWNRDREEYLILVGDTYKYTKHRLDATLVKHSEMEMIAPIWMPLNTVEFMFADDLLHYTLYDAGPDMQFNLDQYSYVIGTTLGSKYVVIIPPGQSHYWAMKISDDFVPISAGLFDMDAKKCFGESVSLQLSAHEGDTQIVLDALDRSPYYKRDRK